MGEIEAALAQIPLVEQPVSPNIVEAVVSGEHPPPNSTS
jgi:hypothetical protein